MRTMLALVFCAGLFAVAPGNAEELWTPEPAASAGKVSRCSVYYENCYFCDGPTYEYICETQCFVCPGSEIDCQPTGWSCGGRSSLPVRGEKNAAATTPAPTFLGGCAR